MSRLLPTLFLLFISTKAAHAGQNDIFRETWTDFIESCEAVFTDFEEFSNRRKDSEGFRIKESKDGRAVALNVGDGGNYLTVFVDKLDGVSVTSCERFNEQYGSFNAELMAEYLVNFLEKENSYKVGGGFVPLYDKSSYHFGILGVFPEYKIPVRVRIYDWGIQFYSELVKSSQ